MSERYIGLISGTSMDGVDAALAEFGDHECTVIAAHTYAYPPAIGRRLENLVTTPQSTLAEIGALDVAVGRFFADCTLALLRESECSPKDVRAIGHHGQTVYHQPLEPEPFSMQLGDPSSIAAITGIDTVADLRRVDLALGGQGAPLVPAFHDWLFRSDRVARVIANIGGISNLTVLVPGKATIGFDTGPGNTLLDYWTDKCLDRRFDDSGDWAASGKIDEALVDELMSDSYFPQTPPKSTGREYFNAEWLEARLARLPGLSDADVQASLVELTARSMTQAIRRLALNDCQLFICGGGSHNAFLLRRLAANVGQPVETTASLGIDPDRVEAVAFAWLARAKLRGEIGNVTSVTGARLGAVLGGLYSGVGA